MGKSPAHIQPVPAGAAACPPGRSAVAGAPGNRLRRSFRVRDGVALIVSNVIGAGVFTTIASISRLAPQPWIYLTLWIAGGALALAGALSYAQLGRRWPSAGGEYVYLSNAYGPTAGFLSGWTSLIAGFSGAVAFGAVAFASYLGQYFPALASDRSLLSFGFHAGAVTVSPRALTAVFVIAAFAVLHACNFGAGKITQNALAFLILGIVAGFCALGFSIGTGSWSHFHSPDAPLRPVNWLLAFIPIMFSYSGWNAASYVAEEMHDTERTIGRALLIGTALIIVLYVLLNALYLYAVPPAQMQDAHNIGAVAAHALFGVGQNFMTPAILVALLGSISAMSIAGPRVYFAMSRDGAFIPGFARISPRFGTPALAIALQALWSILLVLVGGFDQIMMYTGFMILLSSGAAVAGLFVARRRELRLYPKLWLKMLVPAVFVIACTAIVVNTVWGAPKTALLGCLLIAAGLPVFYWSRWRRPVVIASTLAGGENSRLLHRSMPE
ncbi:MAG TPA: amino acid permease [Candidatus Binatia bacterium]|nr:amino acid permease [Candidatus Binatia bacterium]